MKVAWMIPQGEELNWSSALRLRRLDIAKAFGRYHLASATMVYREYQSTQTAEELAYELESFDVVVFAEQSEYDFNLMKALKSRSERPVLIRDHCENMWDFPWVMECFKEADLVVCSSKILAEAAKLRGLLSVACIPEHYERCEVSPISYKPLLAGYMGTDGWLADSIAKIAQRAGWETEILCRPEDGVPGSKVWSEDTWKDSFSKYRVLLAPQRPGFMAKSPAKVVQALGNGLPVIASAIPSYCDLVEHGATGFLCSQEYEWYNAFKIMADDSIARVLYENASKSRIVKEYSLQAIATKWHREMVKAMANKWRRL